MNDASRSRRRCGASKQERDEADRRYNEALTALDRARPAAAGACPTRRCRSTSTSSPTLNEAWNILPAPPAARGLQRQARRLHLADDRARTSSASSRSTRCSSITSIATPTRSARRTGATHGDRRGAARAASPRSPRSRRG